MTAAKITPPDLTQLLEAANISFEEVDMTEYEEGTNNMTASNSGLPTVYEAVRGAMEDVGFIAKNGYNENQRYKFLGIEAITAEVQPALIKNGLTIYPNIISQSAYDREGVNSSGKATIAHFATVVVEYTIVGPAGDTIVSTMVGEASDTADKAMNKALATAAKYFFKQFFWIPTGDEDPDASHEEQSYSSYQEPVRKQAPQSLSDTVRAAAGKPTQAVSVGGGGKMASEAQTRAIWAITHKGLSMDDPQMWDAIDAVIHRRSDKLTDLSMDEAKILIEHFKSLQ
jgi:hypothetical protein